MKQINKTGKLGIVTACVFIMILSLVSLQDRKALAADDKAFYTVRTETNLTQGETPVEGVKMYVTESAVTDGNIKNTQGAVVKLSDLKTDGDAPQSDGTLGKYLLLPTGYQVKFGTLVTVKQCQLQNPTTDKIYYYQKDEKGYQALSWSGEVCAVNVKSNTVFGVDWKLESISAEYNSEKLDEDNRILAGTELSKSDFTVEAVRADGQVVLLKEEDFKVGSNIPKQDVPKCDIEIIYLKDESIKTWVRFDVTAKKLTEITAVNNKTYYAGDKIELKDITVKAYYDNVVTGKTEKPVIISSGYTVTPDIVQVGDNFCTVTYRGKTAQITVNGAGIKEITAEYSGKEVVIGNKFDQSKVKVYVVYTDGKKKLLDQKKDGYVFGTEMINNVGDNEIAVIYGGYTGTFYITGVARAVTKITAEYLGKPLIVGASFYSTDVKVMAFYNDGTEEQVYEFLLSSTVVTKVGANKIMVTYLDKTVTFTVTGVEKQPTSIVAVYNGDVIVAGNSINRNDVSVTAYFDDGTYGTVTDFTLSMETLNGVGMNTITVTYKKAIATIYVLCIAREATALEVVYRGPDIEQNSSFNRDNVVVTATFNDGGTEQVTDFILPSTMVSELGTNYFQVTYGTKSATFTVYGIAKKITGAGTMSVDISNEKYDGITLTAVVDGQQIRENMEVGIEVYEQADLKKIVRKTTEKGRYIGFELDLEGFEFADNQFMTARITVPDGFDPAKVAVYYTPNRKSVMARLGGGLVDSNTYEFYVYRSGTYVLLECDKETLKDADLRDAGNVKGFVFASGVKPVMKVGESLTLESHLLYGNGADETILWSVDDTSVARISSTGRLTAKSSGYVTVKLKTKDGKFSCEYQIEVEEE